MLFMIGAGRHVEGWFVSGVWANARLDGRERCEAFISFWCSLDSQHTLSLTAAYSRPPPHHDSKLGSGDLVLVRSCNASTEGKDGGQQRHETQGGAFLRYKTRPTARRKAIHSLPCCLSPMIRYSKALPACYVRGSSGRLRPTASCVAQSPRAASLPGQKTQSVRIKK